MKRIAITLGTILVLLFAIVVYNVWRAGMTPVTAAPGPLEQSRQQLHEQLEQSKKRESEIELQDWNSVTLLRQLIAAHQERMDKLSGNSQAREIVAWDGQSITRIQARIAELIAKQSEQPAAGQADGSESNANAPIANSAVASKPSVLPKTSSPSGPQSTQAATQRTASKPQAKPAAPSVPQPPQP